MQPKIENYFDDINDMNNNYKYDWYFLANEDVLIRRKLIKKYGKKLKYLKRTKISNIIIKKKKFYVLTIK